MCYAIAQGADFKNTATIGRLGCMIKKKQIDYILNKYDRQYQKNGAKIIESKYAKSNLWAEGLFEYFGAEQIGSCADIILYGCFYVLGVVEVGRQLPDHVLELFRYGLGYGITGGRDRVFFHQFLLRGGKRRDRRQVVGLERKKPDSKQYHR
jgi:hypothetical protein